MAFRKKSGDGHVKKNLGIRKKAIQKHKKERTNHKYVRKSFSTDTSRPASEAPFVGFASNEPSKYYKWSEKDFAKPLSEYKLLGIGGFATVRLGFSVTHRKEVALKIISHEMSLQTEIKNEIMLHKSLTHVNIARLWGWFSSTEITNRGPTNSTVIVMSLYGGDLFNYINEEHTGKFGKMFPRCRNRSAKYSRELISAIDYLQNKEKHIHMDLKPENILVSSEDSIKVSDFGCVIPTKSPRYPHYKHNGGTDIYWPPELFDKKPKFDSTVDVWSIGLIIYQMFHPRCHHPIFDHKSFVEAQIKGNFKPPPLRIMELRDRNSAIYSCVHGQDLQDFLFQIFRSSRSSRPVIADLKKSLWLSTNYLRNNEK